MPRERGAVLCTVSLELQSALPATAGAFLMADVSKAFFKLVTTRAERDTLPLTYHGEVASYRFEKLPKPKVETSDTVFPEKNCCVVRCEIELSTEQLGDVSYVLWAHDKLLRAVADYIAVEEAARG